jgi:uncharacterized protein YjbI with pentapeptide repeats
MTVRLRSMHVRALLASTCLLGGLLAVTSAPAFAAASCPSVNPTTGAMTPEPGLQANLSGCNLTGASFFDINVSGANLSNANLTNAIFLAATVEGVNFTDANLSGANMTGDHLVASTVTGAIMATTTLTDVWTFNTVGKPASLPAGWSDINSYIVGPTADLGQANLSGQNLAGLDLDQAGLGQANLQGANLSGTDLTNADLTSVQSGGVTATTAPTLPAGWHLLDGYLIGSTANLGGATLSGADLAGFDLTQTALDGSDLSNADLSSTNLQGANIQGANLSHANLTGASLAAFNETPVNLNTANLTDANLTNASAPGVNLSSATLSGATLTGTNLTNANFLGANLTGTDLSQATITGAASGSITGTPTLPASWTIWGGYLVGPSANLAGVSLSGIKLTHAVLAGANLTGADLFGAVLPSADFSGADLTSADLTGAAVTSGNFDTATMTSVNLTNANLDGATTTGADLTGATWSNTTCPDGTNSNAYVRGCFSELDTVAPVASPGLLGDGTFVNGWHNDPITVDWNWTDNGTINTAKCPVSSGPATRPVTYTVTCADMAGNVGTATYSLKVDTSLPVVKVTGVVSGHHYAIGRVPKAGCTTTETVSGVQTAAKLTITTGGSHGVGQFTATCAGALSVAGNAQAAPARVVYSVGYGFGSFSTPRQRSTLRKSAHHFTVRFRLVGATGKAVPTGTAKNLAWGHDVRVVLTGPGIKAVNTYCTWNTAAAAFSCTVKIPATARTGTRNRYSLSAQEDVGAPFYAVPAFGKTGSSLTVYFR